MKTQRGVSTGNLRPLYRSEGQTQVVDSKEDNEGPDGGVHRMLHLTEMSRPLAPQHSTSSMGCAPPTHHLIPAEQPPSVLFA